MFRILFSFLIVATAEATSVSPVLRECPICGVKSVTMSLNSYSNYGEPERDLSDSPLLRFSSVEICPGDLYASWSNEWGKIDAAEKAKLVEFLKNPEIRLTEAEEAIVSGHEEALRKSAWFEPLWARACDEFRSSDDRRKFTKVLRMHFEGKYTHEEDWEKQLGSLYRENAISALKEAVEADWPKPHEKRIFAYLRGELIRQAGRDAEALGVFREVIEAEKSAKPDEEFAWISRWATEQSLRCAPEGKDPEKLVELIIPEMPDPWRKRNATEDPRWARHFVALDLLAHEAAEGKKGFSDELWKLLDRKPERLLALLETIIADIDRLPDDARWRKWFDEIEIDLEAGKLPTSLRGDHNKERVINVLRRAVVGGEWKRKEFRNAVLLPAVKLAAAEGGIPVLELPKSNSFSWLPSLGGSDEKTVEEPSLNALSRELHSLWKEQPETARTDIARVYIRILREDTEELESMKYPVSYFLPEIAESEEGRAIIADEVEEEWDSSFGKAVCAYAARLPDSSGALLGHPYISKTDPNLLVKLLIQRSDAGWKEEAIRRLNESEWVPDCIVEYLHGLDLPETRAALDAFAKRARREKAGKNLDGKLSTLRQIDEYEMEGRLLEIPLR